MPEVPKAHVFLAKDTRESSPILLAAVKKGLDCLNVPYTDFGLLTTPQLHYIVAHHKKDYTSECYIAHKTKEYIEFIALCDLKADGPYQREIVLDCANGVGAIPMQEVVKILDPYLKITLINTDTKNKAKLNEGCGAEFVHKEMTEPNELTNDMPSKVACFDGDADRLIYFKRTGAKKNPLIIDGDKQFAFIMMYVKEQLNKLGLPDLSHVMVNTAYANSRASEYLDKNKIHVVCVPTGVKNAEPIAHQYTIGANDEPNGHGTVQINWSELDKALEGKEDELACKKLKALLRISNPFVGDAIANLLLIEAILRDKSFSIDDFSGIYRDNPSQMFKAVVSDRTKFKVIKDESRLTQPSGLQDFIDQASKQIDGGRAFVRPSGTEDILRLYVEATERSNVKVLADQILEEINNNYKDF